MTRMFLSLTCVLLVAICPAQYVKLFKYPTFYEKDFATLKPGKYDTVPAPIGDKKLAAIKVPAGMKVILYDRKNCMGTSFEVYSDIENLRVFGLYGNVSSLKVETTTQNIEQRFITLDNINE